MKIKVKVITRSSENKVEYDEAEDIYRVKVTMAPEKGKANKKVVELLSDYLKVNKSSIQVVVGETSRTKIMEIK